MRSASPSPTSRVTMRRSHRIDARRTALQLHQDLAAGLFHGERARHQRFGEWSGQAHHGRHAADVGLATHPRQRIGANGHKAQFLRLPSGRSQRALPVAAILAVCQHLIADRHVAQRALADAVDNGRRVGGPRQLDRGEPAPAIDAGRAHVAVDRAARGSVVGIEHRRSDEFRQIGGGAGHLQDFEKPPLQVAALHGRARC